LPRVLGQFNATLKPGGVLFARVALIARQRLSGCAYRKLGH